MKISIRLATEKDARQISKVILTTASKQLRDEFSDDGWQLFLKLLNTDTQKSLISNKKFNYYVAEDVAEDVAEEKNTIVGILAIKDRHHLFHLFIDPNWQGQGIGKMFWLNFLTDINKQGLTKITVNSSDYALEFYKGLGFIMDAGRQKKNGICYTPMTYTL